MHRITLLVMLFKVLCLVATARAELPVALPSATTEQIQQTVDHAIGYLQTESASWLKTRKCAACHHVPMPLWALSEAELQGYSIDKKFVADTTESLLGSMEKLMTVPEPMSDAFATGQTLYVLSLAGYTAQQPELKRGMDFLVATQTPEGSWPMLSRSTPDGSPGSSKLLTPITCAASCWAALGLSRLAPKLK